MKPNEAAERLAAEVGRMLEREVVGDYDLVTQLCTIKVARDVWNTLPPRVFDEMRAKIREAQSPLTAATAELEHIVDLACAGLLDGAQIEAVREQRIVDAVRPFAQRVVDQYREFKNRDRLERRAPKDVPRSLMLALYDAAWRDPNVHAFLIKYETGTEPFVEVLIQLVLHQSRDRAQLTEQLIDAAARQPFRVVVPAGETGKKR
ncbi:MAG TPA: hypothetical protein VHM19_22995 [Polyangiales bacterium]|jgi:hypothetical protein|nr:hypothetical protein [Polyangiales bacterium]